MVNEDDGDILVWSNSLLEFAVCTKKCVYQMSLQPALIYLLILNATFLVSLQCRCILFGKCIVSSFLDGPGFSRFGISRGPGLAVFVRAITQAIMGMVLPPLFVVVLRRCLSVFVEIHQLKD